MWEIYEHRRAAKQLESLPAEHGCTLVVVTHDVSIARRAQRCYRLELGRAHEELWLDPTGTWGSS